MKHLKRTIEIGLVMLAMLTALIGVALATALPASAQNDGDRVAVDQDLVIQKGETVAGDVSVTNGNLTLYGTVDGKVSVVNGNADIYGKVLGDVAVLTGGDVTLYEGSSVGGNVLAPQDITLNANSFVGGSVTSVGGQVNRDSAATVKGSVSEMTNPMQAIQNLVQPDQSQASSEYGFFNGSPLGRIAGLFSIGLFSVLIILLSVGMAAVVPNRVRTASATLQVEPGPSIVVGIIAAFLIFPAAGLVAFLLTISVIGIILLPVLAIVLLGAFLFGFVVVSHWLGKLFHDTTRQSPTGLAASHAPTLIIEVLLGVAVVLASTLIPLLFLPRWISALMFLLVYSISCVGIGAAILSRLGTLAPPKMRHQPRIIYPTPVHNHYGASFAHTPPPPQMLATTTGPIEPTNTRPLGPTPTLPQQDR